jgi:hypothetical protein
MEIIQTKKPNKLTNINMLGADTIICCYVLCFYLSVAHRCSMGVLLKKQNKLSREPLLKIDLPKDAEGIDYAEYIESRKKIRDKKNEISTSLDS